MRGKVSKFKFTTNRSSGLAIPPSPILVKGFQSKKEILEINPDRPTKLTFLASCDQVPPFAERRVPFFEKKQAARIGGNLYLFVPGLKQKPERTDFVLFVPRATFR